MSRNAGRNPKHQRKSPRRASLHCRTDETAPASQFHLCLYDHVGLDDGLLGSHGRSSDSSAAPVIMPRMCGETEPCPGPVNSGSRLA
jgi:hypothetical protein